MIHEIKLKDRTVQYALQRKPVKNINLRVKPDCSVFISANNDVTIDKIEEFIISKEHFISKALTRYEEMIRMAPKPKEYVDGESFAILGHDRRLKVSCDKKNLVNSDESYIYLRVKDINDTCIKKKTLEKWLNKQCVEIISDVCQSIYPKFAKYGVKYPEIRFRNMVSRWGSCQPKRGILTFNYALVSAPMACIEYVVVHEFTHFLQPNHSRKFYEQLSMFLPDWQERKKLLDKNTEYSL